MKKSFYYLTIIILFLLGVYTNYKTIEPNNIVGPHEEEYYLHSLLILHSDSTETVRQLIGQLGHKLTFIRSIPFMYIFGESFIIYRISALVLNIIFLLQLYHLLSKKVGYNEALFLVIILLNLLMVYGIMFSGYIDITYMLITGIFFIELSNIFENYDVSKSFFLLITLMLLAKSFSILLLIPICSLVGIYLLLKKRQKKVPLLIGQLGLGFGIYFLLLFLVSTGITDIDIMSALQQFSDGFLIQRNDSLSPLFSMTPFLLINILIIAIAIYNLITNRNRVWTLVFLYIEIFLLFVAIVLNIVFDYRLLLPFYIPYLLLISGFVKSISLNNFKYILIGAAFIFLCTVIVFTNTDSKILYQDYGFDGLNIQRVDFLEMLPVDSTVHGFWRYPPNRPYPPFGVIDCFEFSLQNTSRYFINYTGRMDDPWIPKYEFTDLEHASYVFCIDCSKNLGQGYSLINKTIIHNRKNKCDNVTIEIYKKN